MYLRILVVSVLVSNIAFADIKSDGDLHNGSELSYSINNSLVCGVQIGDSNTSTGSGKLKIGSPSSSDKTEYGIGKVKFIHNQPSETTVNVDVTLVIDDKTTGAAADPSNYHLANYYTSSTYKEGDLNFTGNTVSTTYKTIGSDSYVTEGYQPILYTDLTEADLPYGNLEYKIIMDIICN